MKATASPRLDRTIRLRDGRQLAYAEWGDLAGRPLIWLHGSPASRLFCPDEDATQAAGVRFITIDRPGYGGSDPRPGRSLLDWVDDYAELAEALDLAPCPVVGWSSGGPYALALGIRVPDRVTRIGLAASVGPIEHVPGALGDLDAVTRAAIELAATDRGAGLAAIRAEATWFDGDGWESMFAGSWGIDDDRVLDDPPTLEAMRIMAREAARQGSAGLADDNIAEYSAWGFSVADIRHVVHVWSGASDAFVGSKYADYFDQLIPRATSVTFPEAGHLLPIVHWQEMLAALLAPIG
jgi:pimeloyl-ACP methyl ester carboxylesterase